jgi:DNA-binding transcriptional ArsR family regulator
VDEVYWIQDMETMEVLSDPVRMQIIELLPTPKTVKQLAEAMEVPRTRLYHHIGLLVDAGLITVVESREVRALTERVYRATAKSYQPSKDFLATVDPGRQAQVILDSLFAVTRADFVRTVEDGRVALDGSQKSLEVARRRLTLTPGQLESLIEELGALYERYGELADPEATTVAALSVVYPSSRVG